MPKPYRPPKRNRNRKGRTPVSASAPLVEPKTPKKRNRNANNFSPEKGECRNGANCKFSHDRNSALAVPPAAASESSRPLSVSGSSDESSEESEASEGEIIEARAGAYASLVPPAVANSFLAAIDVPISPAPAHCVVNHVAKKEEPPAHQKQQEPPSKKQKKRGKAEISSPPIKNETNGTAAALRQSAAAVAAPSTNKAKRANVEKQQQPQNNPLPPGFRNLQLPVAAFSCMPTTAEAAPKSLSTKSSSSPQHEPAPPPLPLPTATPAHLKWKNACVATRKHANYSKDFNFDEAQQFEIAHGISTPSDWITTRPYGTWCKSNPAAIAIDCEMCETRDPVSGKVNPKALCRISVVNADAPEEVLLDTLVKPEWPVSDYRTWVNGITESTLKDVEFTMNHAQLFMSALCSEQTLVVGHAVHNDLMALRMVHHCNVDTAMLFSHGGKNLGTVSLKNLALAVMRRDMPNVHDSVNDARVALLCAEHYVINDGKVKPVEKVHRRSSSRRTESDDADMSMLFVHRLPRSTREEHITEMFRAYAGVKPKKVQAIEFNKSHGKCYVEFLTKEDAELTFKSLPGEDQKDKTGRKQKSVGLKGGGYVRVRKMK